MFARWAGGVFISRVQSCLFLGEVTPPFRKIHHHVGRAIDEVMVPSAEQQCRTKSKRETLRKRLRESRADAKTGPGRSTGQQKTWSLAPCATQREREASTLALFMHGCEAACLPWTGCTRKRNGAQYFCATCNNSQKATGDKSTSRSATQAENVSCARWFCGRPRRLQG